MLPGWKKSAIVWRGDNPANKTYPLIAIPPCGKNQGKGLDPAQGLPDKGIQQDAEPKPQAHLRSHSPTTADQRCAPGGKPCGVPRGDRIIYYYCQASI